LDLSIIIPAFNEGRKIAYDIKSAADFLLREHLVGEIIVVDDGSTDDTAERARSAMIDPSIEKRILRHDRNHGKGFAVKMGMAVARGEFVMFSDSGSCTPLSYARRAMDLIRSGQCEIAHGSRKLPDSVILKRQKLGRRIASKLFRAAMGIVMGIPGEMTDTQCGFKVYRGDIGRELYGECRTMDFMFDIEIILRALRKGYRVHEFPIQWTSDHDSRVLPVRTSWRVIGEMISIKQSMKL